MDSLEQLTFIRTLSDIKENLDLELTLIEKVALKKYVREALYEDAKISQIESNKIRGFQEFFPYYDAVARFLYFYYGIDIKSEVYMMLRHKPNEREYLKRRIKKMQEEMHMP